MVEVVFTKDACDFKKGTSRKFDPIVAHGLVITQKVAKYNDAKLQKEAAQEIKRLAKAKAESIALDEEKQKEANDRLKKLTKEKEKRIKAAQEATAKRFVAEKDTRLDDFKNKKQIEAEAKKLLAEKDAFEKEKQEFYKKQQEIADKK